MKYTFVFIGILLLSGMAYSDKPDNNMTQQLADKVIKIGNLSWHTNVKEALKLAKIEDKNVIIMVGEDDCRWCIKMKTNTLTDMRIQEHMKEYILISIKRSDKEAVSYVPEFDGNIPSFFFMTNSAEIIEPIVGYFKPNDFLQYIQEIEEI